MPKPVRSLFFVLVVLTLPLASLFAQSQSSSQQGVPAQQPQAQAQSQAPEQKKDESLADAAKKAQKDRAKPKKVYTEDDLSGMHKGGVSVVGSEKKRTTRRAPAEDPDSDYSPNSEEYWRGRARPLLDEMAAIDERIAQLREDIKKYGNGGFDVQTGRNENIAYIHDRNGQIQDLQKRKADLQKEFEDLEEEGRKAGAPPAWFR